MLDGLGFFDADLMPQAFNHYKNFLEFYFIKIYPYKIIFWKPFTGKTMVFFIVCCWLTCYSNKWDKGDIIIHRDALVLIYVMCEKKICVK